MPQPLHSAGGPGTLDDLKKLDIICFVPAWLPKNFKLKKVSIFYEEPGPDESSGRFPLYTIEYTGPGKATFTIDSAREGIGDRNIMETEDSQETELHSPLFGPVYIIYTPKGKSGVKKEIIANWVEDANMQGETGTDHLPHPILGRYHSFTATGLNVADFAKIIESLHPIRPAQDDDTTSAARPDDKADGNQVERRDHPISPWKSATRRYKKSAAIAGRAAEAWEIQCLVGDSQFAPSI